MSALPPIAAFVIAGYLAGPWLDICVHLPQVGGLSCVQFPSTHAPADDRRFDWAAGIHTVPSTATPSAQKWNDIGADVIFAKKFKWLVRRRNTLVSEGADSLLPCRHRCRVSLSLQFDAHTWRGDGIATWLYKANKYVINQRGT